MRPWWLVVVLAVGGLLTHFVGLTTPRQVIFDEVHFGKFVTAYCCTHERFFDIHPPHAKLAIAGVAWLGGYRGDFAFDHIGEVYPPEVPLFALRLLPAITGVLLPLVLLVLLRQLGVSWPLAFLGGWAVLFDNALTVQTRVIALDGLLLLATLLALSFYLAGERRMLDERRGRTGYRLPWLLFILAGAQAGLALGSKFTGLAALALVALLVGRRCLTAWRQRPRGNVGRWVAVGVVIAASAAIVYLGGWALHFWLLSQPGAGDAFHQATFTDGWQPLTFLREVGELHVVMFDVNYNLDKPHPYASPWWTWPFMTRSVFYWQGTNAFIYFLGNPIVWWGSTVLLIVTAVSLVVRYGRGGSSSTHYSPCLAGRQVLTTNSNIWIPLMGFLIAMLPLVRIPRALFLYHYLTPLLMGIMAGLLWLDGVRLRWRGSRGIQGTYVYALVLGVIIFGFIYFSPLTYGFPLAVEAQPWLFWLKSWR